MLVPSFLKGFAEAVQHSGRPHRHHIGALPRRRQGDGRNRRADVRREPRAGDLAPGRYEVRPPGAAGPRGPTEPHQERAAGTGLPRRGLDRAERYGVKRL